jgi:hypothetical protein
MSKYLVFFCVLSGLMASSLAFAGGPDSVYGVGAVECSKVMSDIAVSQSPPSVTDEWQAVARVATYKQWILGFRSGLSMQGSEPTNTVGGVTVIEMVKDECRADQQKSLGEAAVKVFKNLGWLKSS